ncbi:MAG TPA: GGDEF domain-containing protein [Spirochaetota bacterium]|nr:GGDEF domain-containing protein [Spirochaetota bacterium]
MTLARWLIFIGVLGIIVMSLGFTSLRSDMLERDYTESLVDISNRIALAVNRVFKGADPRRPEAEMPTAVVAISAKYRPELIAVFDRENRVIADKKLYQAIAADELYDSIINEFREGALAPDPGRQFVVRYYNRAKCYLFVKSVTEGRILIIFPYRMTAAAKVRLGLELALLCMGVVLVLTVVYILLAKRKPVTEEPTEESEPYRDVTVDRKRLAKNRENSPIYRDMRNAAAASLDAHVYEGFSAIAARTTPDAVSLYIARDRASRLEKRYELNGQAFLKVDSGSYEAIDVDNEIGEGLRNESLLMLDGGRRVIAPVLYRDALMGAVVILRQLPFSGAEIHDIRDEIVAMAKFINEYMLLNDVMVDRDTGVYSRAFLKLKYDELLNQPRGARVPLAVMAVKAINGTPEEGSEERRLLLQAVAERIYEHLRADDVLSAGDDFVVLMKGAGAREAAAAEEGVLRALSNVRITIDKKSYPLRPFTGIASIEEGSADPLEDARRNLERAVAEATINADGRTEPGA